VYCGCHSSIRRYYVFTDWLVTDWLTQWITELAVLIIVYYPFLSITLYRVENLHNCVRVCQRIISQLSRESNFGTKALFLFAHTVPQLTASGWACSFPFFFV
jgi:hypothetical protein